MSNKLFLVLSLLSIAVAGSIAATTENIVQQQTNMLDTLQAKYEQADAKIKATLEQMKKEALDSYGRKLSTSLKGAQSKGDLDAYTAIEEERKRFEAEKVAPTNSVPAIRDAIFSYNTAIRLAESSASSQHVGLLKSYIAVLDTSMKRLTQEGRIAEAKVAKDRKTAMEFLFAEEQAKIAAEKEAGEAKQNKSKVSTADDHIGPMHVRRDGRGIPGGLILRYSFDRDEGEKVTDRSGKGSQGAVNGAKWMAEGFVGGAFEFDGRGNIQAAAKVNSDITFAVWFKKATLDTGGNTSDTMGLFGTLDPSSGSCIGAYIERVNASPNTIVAMMHRDAANSLYCFPARHMMKDELGFGKLDDGQRLPSHQTV